MMIVFQQQVSKLMELSYSVLHVPDAHFANILLAAHSCFIVYELLTISLCSFRVNFPDRVEPMTTATANQMNYISIKLTTS